MSASVVKKNNVMAGLFVLSSIVLAVAIAFILGDFQLGDKTRYVIRFPTTIGVTGLQSGAEVRYGGLVVGQVVSVAPTPRDGSGDAPIETIDVQVVIDSEVLLYEDALGDLSPPLLGGVSAINIASAGSGAVDATNPDGNALLDEGEVFQGRFAPSILMQLGFTPEDAQKFKTTIDNVYTMSTNATEVTERFRRMSETLDMKFDQGVDDGRGILANVRGLTDRFEGEDGWAARVESILASVDEAAKEAPAVVSDAQQAVLSVRELVDENTMRVTRILDNTERISERVRLETIDQLNDMLSQGTLAMGSASELIDDGKSVLRENRPVIGATMVNARQISLQGKLLVEEIRAQPWRVLKPPKERDLRREPLYEAARSYAGAVSELRGASESLDVAVQAHEDSPALDPEVRAELLRLAQTVDGAYQRYEQAERALLELLSGP